MFLSTCLYIWHGGNKKKIQNWTATGVPQIGFALYIFVQTVKSWMFQCFRFFHLNICPAVKVIAMLGTEFGWSAYYCMHTCLSGITLLPFSCFLCVFLCIVYDLSLCFNVPQQWTLKAKQNMFPLSQPVYSELYGNLRQSQSHSPQSIDVLLHRYLQVTFMNSIL
jgi:hypothetical protein